MFARISLAGDLVVAGCFTEIGGVEMPVEGGVGTCMSCFEDELFRFAGEAFGQVEDGVMLRIDQFDLPALLGGASRLDRR